MQYRALGNSGFEVSVIGFGTWATGARDYGRVEDQDSIKAIRRAFDLGVNLFDTAPIYGSGHAEEVLGRAVEPFRHEVFLATKCGPVEVRPGLVRLDLTADGILAQCDASLRRLRTDHLDLLQVHWNDPACPVAETVAALVRLVESGKVRAIGVSNFSRTDIEAACAAGPVASLQSRYSLLRREVESEILPLCREKNVGFLAYEPLARGLLAGRMDPRRRFEPGDIRARDPDFQGERFHQRLEVVRRFAEFAARHGWTAAQLALAWVAAQPGVTSVLAGAKSAAQAAENAKAADVALDPEIAAQAAEILAPLGSSGQAPRPSCE